MMKRISEIISDICREDPENIVLILYSVLDEDGKRKTVMINNNENCFYFFTGNNGRSEIKIGNEFDVLFMRENPENFETVLARINEIYIYRNNPVKELPALMDALCAIEFVGAMPKLVSELNVWDSKDNAQKLGVLFLTNKNVYDKILEMYNSETETPLG